MSKRRSADNSPANEPPSRPWYRTALFAPFCLFVLTRIFMLGVYQPTISDVPLYEQYFVRTVDFGQVPYAEVKIEYPPLAYSVMVLPGWLRSGRMTPEMLLAPSDARDNLFHEYWRFFRGWMAVFDLVAFVLFVAIVRRVQPALAAHASYAYVVCTFVLSEVIYDHLDCPLAAMLLGGVYCLLRADENAERIAKWVAAAYACFGLGIALKLIPVLLVPALATFELREAWRRKSGRTFLIGMTSLAAATVLPFIPFVLESGGAVFDFLRYHSARGTEIESSWASLQWALSQCGLPAEPYLEYGGWNLRTALERPFAQGATLGVLAVVGLVSSAILAGRLAPDRRSVALWCLWLLLASTLLSKVFSPQFLIWNLPAALILGAAVARPRYWLVLIICGAIALLTTSVFPWQFDDLIRLGRLPCLLIAARNAVFAGLTLWLGWSLVRGDRPN